MIIFLMEISSWLDSLCKIAVKIGECEQITFSCTGAPVGGADGIHFPEHFKEAEKQNKRTSFRMSFCFGAGDEARTRYLHLGKVALYQMSYTCERQVLL